MVSKKTIVFICQTFDSLLWILDGKYFFEIEFVLQSRSWPFLSQGSSSFSRTHVPIEALDHSFFHSLTKRSQVTCCCWWIIGQGHVGEQGAGNRLTDALGQNLEIIFDTIGITMLVAYDLALLCGKQAPLKYWLESNRHFLWQASSP